MPKLSRKREQAVAALLAQPTIERAAAAVGVNEWTLRQWLKDPEFTRGYRAARRQVVEAAIGRLQQACDAAVETLVGALNAPRASSRIRAALGLLDRAVRGVELADVVERVEALEALAKQKRGQS